MGKKFSKVFVGLDVHKESIEVALAEGECAVRHQGRIGGDRAAWQKLVRQLVECPSRIEHISNGIEVPIDVGPKGRRGRPM